MSLAQVLMAACTLALLTLGFILRGYISKPDAYLQVQQERDTRRDEQIMSLRDAIAAHVATCNDRIQQEVPNSTILEKIESMNKTMELTTKNIEQRFTSGDRKFAELTGELREQRQLFEKVLVAKGG